MSISPSNERPIDRKPVILMVDDVESQRKLYQFICERVGVEADIVGDCAAVHESIKRSQFDLIIMDWTLHDLTGLECARQIREILKEKTPPIVCVTGHTTEQDRSEILQAGMDDYLAKPFSLEQFLEVIERWTGCKIDLKVKPLTQKVPES